MTSRLAEIIDFTAVKAAGIPGISAVAGMGSGLYNDPLRPGNKIAPATDWPAVPFTHQSVEPSAPEVLPYTQDGDILVVWTIPMRLWFSKAPLDQIRRMALPFYDLYLAAFASDFHLGGLCLSSRISRFGLGQGGNWSWMAIDLKVTEHLNYFRT